MKTHIILTQWTEKDGNLPLLVPTQHLAATPVTSWKALHARLSGNNGPRLWGTPLQHL